MNLLLINCKKDKDGSFRHTVFTIKNKVKEVIFDKWFAEIIGKEWVEEFRIDPNAFMAKYHAN